MSSVVVVGAGGDGIFITSQPTSGASSKIQLLTEYSADERRISSALRGLLSLGATASLNSSKPSGSRFPAVITQTLVQLTGHAATKLPACAQPCKHIAVPHAFPHQFPFPSGTIIDATKHLAKGQTTNRSVQMIL